MSEKLYIYAILFYKHQNNNKCHDKKSKQNDKKF